MLNIIRNIIFYFLFYSWSVIFFLFFFPVKFFTRKFTVAISDFWTVTIIKLTYWVLGIKYKIEGKDNIPDYPFIVASKHQSAWETFFLPMLFKNSIFVLKKELDKIPILKAYFKKLGYIYIDKKSNYSSMKVLLSSARKSLENDINTIMIFPEGTRVKVNEKKEISSGVFALYKNLRIPVLPITHDSGKYWINKKILKKGGEINVSILPPIKPGLSRKTFTEKLNNIYQSD